MMKNQTVFLHLTNLTAVDSGIYTCECSKPSGTYILNLNVTVEGMFDFLTFVIYTLLSNFNFLYVSLNIAKSVKNFLLPQFFEAVQHVYIRNKRSHLSAFLN